jgi:hypothetical protein
VSGGELPEVYDHAAGAPAGFSGTLKDGEVKVYGHTEACHVIGRFPKPNHHGNDIDLEVDVTNGTFRGYDHPSRSPCTGTFQGDDVTPHDDETNEGSKSTLS